MGKLEDELSFIALKEMARNLLPRNSLLRSIILSEPDCLPRAEGLAKLEIFLKILQREFGE